MMLYYSSPEKKERNMMFSEMFVDGYLNFIGEVFCAYFCNAPNISGLFYRSKSYVMLWYCDVV